MTKNWSTQDVLSTLNGLTDFADKRIKAACRKIETSQDTLNKAELQNLWIEAKQQFHNKKNFRASKQRIGAKFASGE